MRRILISYPGALRSLQTKTTYCRTPADSAHSLTRSPTPIYPLHDAVLAGHTNCVRYLLAVGGEVSAKSPPCIHGCTALDIATHRGLNESINPQLADIVELLLQYGSDPNRIIGEFMYPHELMVWGISLEENHSLRTLRNFLQRGAVTDIMRILPDGRRVVYPDNRMLAGRMTPVAIAILFHRNEHYKELLLHGALNQLYIRRLDGNATLRTEPIPFYIINSHRNPPTRSCMPSQTTAIALRALKLYQGFGGNLWEVEKHHEGLIIEADHEITKDTALDVLRSSDRLMAAMPGLAQELENIMTNPRSLMETARISIMKSMGNRYKYNIDQLPLPRALKSYLRYEDL